MILDGGRKIQKDTEIPADEEFTKIFNVNSDRKGDKYMHVSIEAKKMLNDLKHGNESRLIN